MPTMPHRFGMFVHFGPYALTGVHEQVRMRRGISRAEYASLAASFKPTEFNAAELVTLAKDAGMEYICFTSKHHDDFCMWDTETTDFNIMKTLGRDLLAELAAECERQGVALSIYYSNPDWNHPNAYNPLSTHQCPPEDGDRPDSALYREYVKSQIRELLTRYGKIYTLFWDIPPKIFDPSLNALARELQPGILINDRGWSEGDFSTPERSIPDGESFTRFTEACQSVGRSSWGYREGEDYFSPAFLARSIDRILQMGGSYLLNIGPDASGRIPREARELVREVGEWYKSVREAFDATPAPELSSGDFFASRRGETVYLHLKQPPISSGLELRGIESQPKSAVLLNDSRKLTLVRDFDPEDFTGIYGECRAPILRLKGLPLDTAMPLVIRIVF